MDIHVANRRDARPIRSCEFCNGPTKKKHFCSKKCYDNFRHVNGGRNKGIVHDWDWKRIKTVKANGTFKGSNNPMAGSSRCGNDNPNFGNHWNKPRIIKKCALPECNKSFEISPTNAKAQKRRYCSNSCAAIGEKTINRYNSKCEFISDLGHLTRSKGETGICRILKINRIPYNYEPKSFNIQFHNKNSRYIPDLYLPSLDEWWDVKPSKEGIEYLKEKTGQDRVEKALAFKIQYPNIKFKLVVFKEPNLILNWNDSVPINLSDLISLERGSPGELPPY